MCLADLLERLHRAGLTNAYPARIYHGIAVGHLPKPRLTAGLKYDFDEADFTRIRDYLRNPPRPGRRPATTAASTV